MYFLRIFSTISSSDIVTSPSEEWFQREFQQRYLQVSIQHVLLYTYFFENLFIEASRDSIRNTTRFFFLWLLQDILKKFHSSWNKSTGFYGFFFQKLLLAFFQDFIRKCLQGLLQKFVPLLYVFYSPTFLNISGGIPLGILSVSLLYEFLFGISPRYIF